MFTGIVEELGRVRALRRSGRGALLEVAAERVLEGTRVGDSISVDGVCLTVVALGPGWFRAELVEETLNRTTLGGLNPGSPVNLERSLRADSRLGGHMVMGHVDGVGTILRKVPGAGGATLEVAFPSELRGFLAPKGSVAVDGVSLTVTRVRDSSFEVALIPHTLEVTTLGRKGVGAKVNIEVDVVARYVASLLGRS